MDAVHQAEIERLSEACSAPHTELLFDEQGRPINEPWDGYHDWLEAIRIAEIDAR